jgi:hypothetical protein
VGTGVGNRPDAASGAPRCAVEKWRATCVNAVIRIVTIATKISRKPTDHDDRTIELYHLDNGYWGAVVVVNGNRSMNNAFIDTDEALDWINEQSKP